MSGFALKLQPFSATHNRYSVSSTLWCVELSKRGRFSTPWVVPSQQEPHQGAFAKGTPEQVARPWPVPGRPNNQVPGGCQHAGKDESQDAPRGAARRHAD
jgi:hypothetical protein